MTVAAIGNSGGATELFRGTHHSPSSFSLSRAGVGQDVVDFCIPCNPYFPTPAMFAVLAVRLRDILTYYPSPADTITAELAGLLGLQPQTMAMGNGSTELITWIDHLLVKESLAVPIPTFGRWTDQPMETGKRVDMFQLPEADGFRLDPEAFVSFVRSRGSRVAVICNPNNPDGGLLSRRAVISMMDALADLDLVVIDESFLEFADAEAYPSVVDEAVLRPNVIVLRSLGKNFGLHGVRFGYLVANPALAGQIRARLPKWNLNSFAEVIVFMLKRYQPEYAQSLRMLSRDRQEMTAQLANLPGLTVYPSQGNFVFVKLPEGADGAQVRDRLLAEHGVLVRECGNKLGSSSRFMRLVVRSQPDVRRLLTGLSTVLYGTAWYAPQPSLDHQPSYALEQQPSYALDERSSYAQAPQPALHPADPLQATQDDYGPYAAQQAAPAAYLQPQAQPMAELTPAAYTPAGQMPPYQAPLPQPAPAFHAASQVQQPQPTGAYARLRAMQEALRQPAWPGAGSEPAQTAEQPSGGGRMTVYAPNPASAGADSSSMDDTLIYMPTVVTDSAPDPAPASAPARPAPEPLDSEAPSGGGALRRYPRPAAYRQADGVS
ncbi:pyridoxal phosphate-dependent aminotransferase [Streptomyces sparsogenes]|uniref:pyridoxal phosphate-dependent aminotransferase n=1 Tax=Streptomyces sparsogenes TaxID=67365 RepID=UPI000978E9BF|nr:histidinol-phosphate transaminase [Streptomyces sparsogenes]